MSLLIILLTSVIRPIPCKMVKSLIDLSKYFPPFHNVPFGGQRPAFRQPRTSPTVSGAISRTTSDSRRHCCELAGCDNYCPKPPNSAAIVAVTPPFFMPLPPKSPFPSTTVPPHTTAAYVPPYPWAVSTPPVKPWTYSAYTPIFTHTNGNANKKSQRKTESEIQDLPLILRASIGKWL